MNGNLLNVRPMSVAAAKAALVQQYGCRGLRHRATMLWGTGVLANRRWCAKWHSTTACRWSVCG